MNLLERLRREHREFLVLAEEVERGLLGEGRAWNMSVPTAGAAGAALEALRRLAVGVLRHEAAEKELLYAELARRGGAFRGDFAEMEKEHEAIDRRLAEVLRGMEGADGRPAAWLLLSAMQVVDLVRSHILREEMEVFAEAARVIPAEDLERLGRESVKEESCKPRTS